MALLQEVEEVTAISGRRTAAVAATASDSTDLVALVPMLLQQTDAIERAALTGSGRSSTAACKQMPFRVFVKHRPACGFAPRLFLSLRRPCSAESWCSCRCHTLSSSTEQNPCSAAPQRELRSGAPGLATEVLAQLQGAISSDRLASVKRQLHFLDLHRLQAIERRRQPEVQYVSQCRTVQWGGPRRLSPVEVCMIFHCQMHAP